MKSYGISGIAEAIINNEPQILGECQNCGETDGIYAISKLCWQCLLKLDRTGVEYYCYLDTTGEITDINSYIRSKIKNSSVSEIHLTED